MDKPGLRKQILNQRVCGGGILSRMMSSELAACRQRTRVSCREEPWILTHLTSFSASRGKLVLRRQWNSRFSRKPSTFLVWNREAITSVEVGPDIFRGRGDENEGNGGIFSGAFCERMLSKWENGVCSRVF